MLLLKDAARRAIFLLRGGDIRGNRQFHRNKKESIEGFREITTKKCNLLLFKVFVEQTNTLGSLKMLCSSRNSSSRIEHNIFFLSLVLPKMVATTSISTSRHNQQQQQQQQQHDLDCKVVRAIKVSSQVLQLPTGLHFVAFKRRFASCIP